MNYRPIDIARKWKISTPTLRRYEDMGIIHRLKEMILDIGFLHKFLLIILYVLGK